MPKPWRLTRQAETSLIDIANWTLETFGPRQAAAYEEDLIARCTEIAAGMAMSQDCRRIIDPELPEEIVGEGWARSEAVTVFRGVWEGLRPAAERRFAAIVEPRQ